MQRCLAVGPLVRHHEIGAEATGRLVDQARDLGDRLLGRTDHGPAAGVDSVDHLVDGLGARAERRGQHLVEVVEEGPDAEGHVLARLLLGVGDVHRPDEAPLAPVDRGVELASALLHDAPVVGEDVEALLHRGADREQAEAEAARRARARRRDRRGDGDVEARVRVGAQLEPRVLEREPAGVAGDGLTPVEQGHDRLERLLHHVALLGGVDAHHHRVRRQLSGPDAQHRAAARQVVEEDHAVGEHQRLVVGERAHAGAELDAPRALGGDADEDLGRRDDLVAGGVVLADPGFLEAELVEPLDQLEVALERERGVLAGRMERGHEDAEAHRPVEGHQSSRSGCSRTMRSYSGWKLNQPAK